ncbi:MAG: OmpA family protein [Bacteroidales bacterium]|nr:OmpA family protein [Bacteroidales bacterium]
MKKLLILITFLAFVTFGNAQTQDKKWNIGFHGGATQYKGDLGNDFYKTDMAFYGFGGISFSTYLGKHIDLNLLVTKGVLGFNRPEGYFNNNFTSALLNFRFNLFSPEFALRPYVFVGAGALLFDKNLEITEKKVDFVAPSFGGGLNIRITPSLMLNLQETFMYSTNDERDGSVGDINDAYLFHSVGLTFNFGQKKDADNDGIADRYDKCADTPKDVAVDQNGCPVDFDNDRIADYLDKCPGFAGTQELNGCPDTDKDGIIDINDDCPDVAGIVALKGCPDSDGDGVTDLKDKCPDTKAGYMVNADGCPEDNDKDGILNQDDRCPELAGPASLNGCPDTDGDGVADIDDRCPEVKGMIENKGCPEITKEVITKIASIANKVFFESGKDVLKASSKFQLDELAKILSEYDKAKLLVEGYTDSQGSDASNLVLSQERTDAVKSYLVSKGISSDRITTIGYGEANPVADNKTAAGREKNRRVALVTTY